MSALEQMIRTLAADGVQMHVFPTNVGFQANVKEPGSNGWTCVTLGDAIDALGQALRQRAARSPDRVVLPLDEPEVIDIEDFIAAADAAVAWPDPLDDMFG